MQIMFMFAVQKIIWLYDTIADWIYRTVKLKPFVRIPLFVLLIVLLLLIQMVVLVNVTSNMSNETLQVLGIFEFLIFLFVLQPIYSLAWYKLYRTYNDPAILEFYGPQSLSNPLRFHRSRLRNKLKPRKPSDDTDGA